MLNWDEINSRAVAFQKTWKDCSGQERQQAQTFEKDFMRIFGVDFRDGLHEHQVYLKDGTINFIDYLLPGKILIEMKSSNQSLDKAFTQAMGYFHALKPEEQPVLVMVSDFDQIKVYNVAKDYHYKPFKVKNLKQHIKIFSILTGRKDDTDSIEEIGVNTQASYKMAQLHDELKKYGYEGHELEIFLVRILFCLFADDTGIFEKDIFLDYIKNSKPDGSDLSSRISELFFVLDTPPAKRMKNLSPELKKFRYINGKLFSEKLPPACFNEQMTKTLIDCCNFDWSSISPAIFGSMFQSIMDQDKRRELGAHYTSEENILKVIRPLFLDELEQEFEKSQFSTKDLEKFHDKLGSIKFLDPACGSGNFLIVAYQELRLLEAKVMRLLYSNALFNFESKVHIGQFYGIEYEEFPCEVAKVSMLLMKHLLDQKIGEEFGMNIVEFPIKENANIVHGNSLRLDWSEITDGYVDYIFGNPPYVGAMLLTPDQTNDIKNLLKSFKCVGELDYITGWFYKAKLLLDNTLTKSVAFVSTNSICQGQQAITLWQEILKNNTTKIHFAYNTFPWQNEAKYKAQVHCIIVGLTNTNIKNCNLFKYDANNKIFDKLIVSNINQYLIDAPNVFLEIRKKPISFKNQMYYGSMPRDGQHFQLTDNEKQQLILEYPNSQKFIRSYIGAKEFINRISRWVLWLVDASPSEIKTIKPIYEKVELVKKFRLSSKAKDTQKFATTPHLFCHIAQPTSGNYLLVPRVTSSRRTYIPIGYENYNTIVSDAAFVISNADLTTFAVITSQAHMIWMKNFAGKLKSDYRYSKDFIYNTFPVPEFDEDTKAKLEETAKAILQARDLYPDSTYADLYDDTLMPIELRKAHQKNDEAVRKAYGNLWKKNDEEGCLAALIKLYKKYIETEQAEQLAKKESKSTKTRKTKTKTKAEKE